MRAMTVAEMDKYEQTLATISALSEILRRWPTTVEWDLIAKPTGLFDSANLLQVQPLSWDELRKHFGVLYRKRTDCHWLREIDNRRDKTQRCFKALELIQKEGGLTASQLADRLKTSKRTVYRYIGDIRKAGYKINSDGRKGYYLDDD